MNGMKDLVLDIRIIKKNNNEEEGEWRWMIKGKRGGWEEGC